MYRLHTAPTLLSALHNQLGGPGQPGRAVVTTAEQTRPTNTTGPGMKQKRVIIIYHLTLVIEAIET